MVASTGVRKSQPRDGRRAGGGTIDPPRALTRSEISQRYKERHPDRVIAKNQARLASGIGLINQLKDVPCMDCGGRFPPECMDFDHVRGQKKIGVGSLARRRGATPVLLAEIAKCEVVCANCHRIRTRRRGQYKAASAA